MAFGIRTKAYSVSDEEYRPSIPTYPGSLQNHQVLCQVPYRYLSAIEPSPCLMLLLPLTLR